MQEENTESVKFLALRQEKGWTLAQAAEYSGYGVSTINGLEKRGEGSERLKERLMALYTGIENPNTETEKENTERPKKNHSENTQQPSHEEEPSPAEWKRRALVAEAKLKNLQEACNAMGQHVQALGCTVQSFGRIISE